MVARLAPAAPTGSPRAASWHLRLCHVRARYARQISSAVVVRVIVMLVVVAIVGGWLHLWWLALVYAAFWAYMIFRVQRGSRQP